MPYCPPLVPDAPIVVDKFHVPRLANQAVNELRRSLSRSKDADRLQRKAAEMKRDTCLFRKLEKDLDDGERVILDGWLRSIPELGETWRLKEGFYGICDARTKEDARQRYLAWAGSVPAGRQSAFQPILTAWKNWESYIPACFGQQVTNVFTSSLNNLIRVTNRMGRGYRFEVVRAKILFTRGTHKKTIQPPWFRQQPPTEEFRRYLVMDDLAGAPSELDYGAGL